MRTDQTQQYWEGRRNGEETVQIYLSGFRQCSAVRVKYYLFRLKHSSDEDETPHGLSFTIGLTYLTIWIIIFAN
jgi:hypothetical protein